MGTRKVGKGAALEWTERELGGPVNEVEGNTGINTGVSQIVGGNADRVALVFVNTGANDAHVFIGAGLVNSAGILLGAGGGILVMTLRDDYTLPTRAFFVAAVSGTTQIYSLEYVRFTTTEAQN